MSSGLRRSFCSPPVVLFPSNLTVVFTPCPLVCSFSLVLLPASNANITCFAAQYFGTLFILIGALVFWKIFCSGTSVARKGLLTVFAGFVLISGFLCFVLDTRLFKWSPAVKVPLYAILGMAVCFALVFSSIDLLNWCLGACCGTSSGGGLVENGKQVLLVLSMSTLMGASFGLIFGMLDVEDFVGLQLRDALVREEQKCIPVGIVLGAVAALLNEQMAGDRDPSPEQRGFSRVPTRDLEEDGL